MTVDTTESRTAGRVGCALWPGYAPEWTFVVGRDFLAAVPVATSALVLDSLRDLDEHPGGVSLDDVLAAMAAEPTATAPVEPAVASLVVAVPGESTDEDGAPVSIFVRGPIVVDVFSIGGSRRIADAGRAAGVRADFQAVTGLAFGSALVARVDPAQLRSGQPIGRGAISGSALYWSTAQRPEAEAPAAAAAPVAAAAPPTGFRAAGPVSGSGDVTKPVGVHDPAPDAAFGDTIVRPQRSGLPGPTEGDRHRDADTVLRPAVRPSRPRPSVAPADAPTPIARYGFRLPDGSERRLDAVYRLGRRPMPSRVGDGQPSRLITISSATSAVSATHLEIRQDGDSVVVTDVGSTNGTTVLPPRGRRQRLRAGQSLAVRPGTRVDIGDGNIIEVLR